jgi:glutamyl-tRNA synthetase
MTLRRPDGSFIFHFCNVVDDIEMGITHVLRGEDHLMNTPKHLELFAALEAQPPVFAHIPLFLNPDGSKMSKRDQGAAMKTYAQEAFVPAAVRNYLCLLGWSPKDDREKLSIEEVMALFDWEHLNRSTSRFDYQKLIWLNGVYLAEMPTTQFVATCQDWLEKNQPELISAAGNSLEAALALIHPKVKHVPEIVAHLTMLFSDAAPLDEAGRQKVAAQANAAALLAALQEALAAVSEWTEPHLLEAPKSAAAQLGVKPGALLFPLRLAVTGSPTGVDLIPALELLGRETVLRRLQARSHAILS